MLPFKATVTSRVYSYTKMIICSTQDISPLGKYNTLLSVYCKVEKGQLTQNGSSLPKSVNEEITTQLWTQQQLWSYQEYTVNNNAVNILCIHTQVLLCVKVNKLYSSTSSANINNSLKASHKVKSFTVLDANTILQESRCDFTILMGDLTIIKIKLLIH